MPITHDMSNNQLLLIQVEYQWLADLHADLVMHCKSLQIKQKLSYVFFPFFFQTCLWTCLSLCFTSHAWLNGCTACKAQLQRDSHTYNNNNEYLEHLTHTGPKRLHVLYKHILSKFNAYNMNAHTHTCTCTHTHLTHWLVCNSFEACTKPSHECVIDTQTFKSTLQLQALVLQQRQSTGGERKWGKEEEVWCAGKSIK